MTSWSCYKKWFDTLLSSQLPAHQSPPNIDDWCLDSRKISPGSWFIPIVGEKHDGHQFIKETLEKGAGGFLYQKEKAHHLSDGEKASGIAVADTLNAYQKLASGWRTSLKGLKMFAITGSVGKTTCKEMLQSILNTAGPTLATFGNYNNEIGVPKTLLSIKPFHQYAVIEMGARRPGDIKKLVNIAKPNISCCLNARTAHLEIFKSEQAILNTKLEIVLQSESAEAAVVFHDDPRILEVMKAHGRDFISFGYSPDATVNIVKEKWINSSNQMELLFKIENEEYHLTLPALHSAFPINAAASIAMAHTIDIPIKQAIDALSSFTGVSGRFKTHHKKGLTFIDDAYNANLDSMEAGLHSFAKLYPNKEKILILGDMLELGAQSVDAHKKIGTICASIVKPKLLITIGSRAKQIAESAIADGLTRKNTQSFSDIREYLEAQINLANKGEVVFIKGSNSVGLNRIFDLYN
mgnify:CR=1 FL=1